MNFSDDELLRYSRHLLLPELGLKAQSRWWESRVCVFGCGGLGNPVALYLAAAGVGHITLVDSDVVELSNLQRQIAFSSVDIGCSKAQTLRSVLVQLNPNIDVKTVEQYITQDNFMSFDDSFDLYFDCTDQFTSRYLVNQLCVITSTALVSGAAIEFQGLCGVFNGGADEPCYECLFPAQTQETQRATCAESGIFSPVLGVIASIQADLGLQYLAGSAGAQSAILHRWDALAKRFRKSQLYQDPACPLCSDNNEVVMETKLKNRHRRGNKTR